MSEQQQARRISFPAKLAAGYVLLGGLWVLSSDWLLGLLVSDAGRIVQLGSWKGVGFVLVTGLMLYTVLNLQRMPAPAAAGDKGAAEPLRGWSPLLVFAVLALVLGSFGYSMYRGQANDFRNRVHEVQSAIAELKARQLEQWLGERRADAEILRSSGAFAESVLRLERPGRNAVAKEVRRSLEILRSEYDLASVELFDREGRLLLQVGGEGMPGSVLRKAVAAAIATDLTQFTDLHLMDGSTTETRIDFVIPLGLGGDRAALPVGALALRVDPQRFLFPLIQSEPMPSQSGETVLVRREGQEAVFLNRLRHVDNKPFELRRPLSQETLPAVQAIRNGAGIYEGLDYRGVKVMTAFRPVGGTSWLVGAKTDVDEVMSPLRQKARLMFVMVGLAIGAGALFIGLFWREQRSRYLIGRYRDQLERQALVKHFDQLVKYARDIVLLMDPQGNILDANDAAIAAYGYQRDELSRMNIRDIRTPEARSALEHDFDLAARPGGALIETVHRRKDGSAFPVEASERVIEVEGRRFRQSIVRDITARREAEAEIRRLDTAYALLSETNEAIVRVGDRQELFDRVCRVAVAFGGYRSAWIGWVDEAARRIAPVALAGACSDDLREALISADAELPEGRGPSGVALREDRAFICNDIFADPAQAPWWEPARKLGIKSVAAMPLKRAGKPVGVLNLCSAETGAFDDRVLDLLREMAVDISFALDNLAHDEERRLAVQTLQENEELFRSIVEQNVSAIFIVGDGRFIYVNSHAAEILGYRQDELEGVRFEQVVSEPDRASVSERARQLLSGELRSVGYTFTALRKDGTPVEIGAHGARAVFRGRQVIIGVAQDIGERLRAEEQIRQYVARLEQSTLTTVQAVSAMVELRDPYTAGHERRVGELAAAIGAEMKLPENMVKGLRITGYVHDIGKISIPAEILSKPGRLTATEFELIKNHARVGYEILKDVEFPWPVAKIILQHHERIDGSGYPQQLRDDGIMLEARILAVADVVESMGSHRPYRPALGIEAALEEINRNSGRLYDENIVAACTRLFREKGYTLAL